MKKIKLERQPAILHKDGKPVGTMWVAFTNIEDSDSGVITISDEDKSILDVIDAGTTLVVASSNDSAKIQTIDNNRISMSKPIFSANVSILKRGEILILKDDSCYLPENEEKVV